MRKPYAVFIGALLCFLLLLTACDKNAINQLAREERDKLEADVKQYLGDDYEIEEFLVKEERFEENKTKYVMECMARLNKKPLGFLPQEIPGRLTFEKKDRKWRCTFNSFNLASGFNLFGQSETPSNPFNPGDVIPSVKGLIDGFDQVLLNMTALSTAEENEIGNKVQQQILSEVGRSSSSKFDIQSVFRKIKNLSTRPDLAWECSVTSDTQFNAFAVAGGKTFLNQGMLRAIDSEAELAFVIAHEVAHNDLKHCVQKIQHAVRASQIDPRLGEVVGVAYSVYQHPYSQDIEYAADKRGVELMTAAGYSKQGAISFFRKLQKFEPSSEDPTIQAVNDFISTHPTAQKRIERIEKM